MAKREKRKELKARLQEKSGLVTKDEILRKNPICQGQEISQDLVAKKERGEVVKKDVRRRKEMGCVRGERT